MYRDPRRMDDAGPKVVQFLDRVRDQNANPTSPLNRYIEGWAQTDLEKILDATAPSYRFTDPFVGTFVRRSLHKYFDLLRDRLSRTGATCSGRSIAADFNMICTLMTNSMFGLYRAISLPWRTIRTMMRSVRRRP